MREFVALLRVTRPSSPQVLWARALVRKHYFTDEGKVLAAPLQPPPGRHVNRVWWDTTLPRQREAWTLWREGRRPSKSLSRRELALLSEAMRWLAREGQVEAEELERIVAELEPIAWRFLKDPFLGRLAGRYSGNAGSRTESIEVFFCPLP